MPSMVSFASTPVDLATIRRQLLVIGAMIAHAEQHREWLDRLYGERDRLLLLLADNDGCQAGRFVSVR